MKEDSRGKRKMKEDSRGKRKMKEDSRGKRKMKLIFFVNILNTVKCSRRIRGKNDLKC
jgi:hypothetical protein